MTADYTYGEARDVADRLLCDPDVSQGDLHAALINALERIDALERQVRELRAAKPSDLIRKPRP